MASRDPQQLIPEMWNLFGQFRDEMIKAGEDFIVTCTYRSQQEQSVLYEQGRTKPGPIVTWTRNSKHTERKAFDIAVIKNGKITWAVPDYKKAVEIGIKVGLECGGSWGKSKDWPHFQYKEVKNDKDNISINNSNSSNVVGNGITA